MAKKINKNKSAAKKAPSKPVKKVAVKKPAVKKAAAKKNNAKKAPVKKQVKAVTKKVVKSVKKSSKPAPKKAIKNVAAKKSKPAAKKVIKKTVVKKPAAVAKKSVKPVAKKVSKPIVKKVTKVAASKPVNAPVKKASAVVKAPATSTAAVQEVKKKKPEKIVKFPKLQNAIKKSRAAEATEITPVIVPIQPKKEIIVKNTDMRSRYSDEELMEFKEIILKKLDDARKDYEILKDNLSHKDDNGTDDTSPTFKLLEDGSDVMSKEETAQLAARQQKFIENLENALIRIENKTYGICRVTGRLISKERLRSVPHATLSIEAKMQSNN